MVHSRISKPVKVTCKNCGWVGKPTDIKGKAIPISFPSGDCDTDWIPCCPKCGDEDVIYEELTKR